MESRYERPSEARAYRAVRVEWVPVSAPDRSLSLAEIKNGTGFDKDARFVQVSNEPATAAPSDAEVEQLLAPVVDGLEFEAHQIEGGEMAGDKEIRLRQAAALRSLLAQRRGARALKWEDGCNAAAKFVGDLAAKQKNKAVATALYDVAGDLRRYMPPDAAQRAEKAEAHMHRMLALVGMALDGQDVYSGGNAPEDVQGLLDTVRALLAQRARSSAMEKLGERTLEILGEWIPELPDYTAENASPRLCLGALQERARVCALRYADIQRAARALSPLPRAQEGREA